MPYKRKTPYSRKAIAKKPRNMPYRRPLANISNKSNYDGQTVLVSAYFETGITTPGTNGGIIAWSLKLDPTAMALSLTPVGNSVTVAAQNADNVAMTASAGNTSIQFPRLTALQAMYRQFRINSAKIKVTVDRNAGLDNPVICLTDNGDGTPVTTVGHAMSQAHKAKTLTEAYRTADYGWSATSAQDKEFHMISDGISESNAVWLKVLQEYEAGATCKQRIEVSISVTLKDSTHLN